MPLRDYQQKTLDKILASMRRGNRSIIVQQPPRTGKTVIMAEIAKRTVAKGGTVLFLVHRKELIAQAQKTFEKWGVDLSQCEFMMIQTAARRVAKLKKPTLLLIDEAHHAKSNSYVKVLNHLGDCFKLLFTATPKRTDGKGFDDIATDLIEGERIKDLIKRGFLAPVDYYAPDTSFDTSKLKTKRGEFTQDSIDDAFKRTIYGDVLSHYRNLAGGKQAICYTAGVKRARQVARMFCQHGIKAAAIDGTTPAAFRDKMIEDYRNGKITILTNCDLFTEGLDLPNVDCVIMLRPTQSESLYLQFAMRSMNPRKGKTAIIIDHVGNIQRFGSPTADRHWSLKGREKHQRETADDDGVKIATCPQCYFTFERKPGIVECPMCGELLSQPKNTEIEVKGDAKLVKVESAERLKMAQLIINDKLANQVADKSPDELTTYAQLKMYAKLHGYKPGWAYFRAKQKGLKF